jgi:hypothetical protein
LAVPVGTILARELAEHKDCGRFFRDGGPKKRHDVREEAPTGARRGKKHPQGKCKKHPQGPGKKARRVYNQRAVPSGLEGCDGGGDGGGGGGGSCLVGG